MTQFEIVINTILWRFFSGLWRNLIVMDQQIFCSVIISTSVGKYFYACHLSLEIGRKHNQLARKHSQSKHSQLVPLRMLASFVKWISICSSFLWNYTWFFLYVRVVYYPWYVYMLGLYARVLVIYPCYHSIGLYALMYTLWLWYRMH